MRRATFACGLVLATSGCAGSAPAPATPAPAPPANDARVLTIADAVVAQAFEEAPDRATLRRIPGARFDALPDDSLAAIARRRDVRAGWIAELANIDPASLSDPMATLAYALAKARLDDRAALEICRFELWNVSQIGNAWQVRFADMAQAQPVGSDDLRAQALRRYAGIPDYIAVQEQNLRAGLERGYAPPAVAVERVIQQLEALATGAPETSPFASPAERDPDAAFRAKFLALVRDALQPALAKHRDFLRHEVLPRARTEPGVSANPDGAACYRATIQNATTLPLDAETVHAEGIASVAAIRAEMDALSIGQFDGVPTAELLQRFKTEKRFLQTGPDAVMEQAQDAIDRAKAAMPQAFGILPQAPVILEPIPKFQERSAAAHYLAAALDGSRPAAYRVRLYEADRQSVVIGESTAFHEVIPGHHLQIAIASERTSLPTIARWLGNSGFSEGWALYAERLADEMGLYTGPADRFGMLSNFAWRSVRLVVDTGIHAKGWDRERAIAMLLENTALSREQAAAEIDRYIAWPGQATSYMVGYLEIQKLRNDARRALGKHFDLREFHDQVLEHGSVPLPVLRERTEAWISRASAEGVD